MISSFLKRLLFGGLTLSASLVHSDPDKASTYRALMEHAQTQAHVRACVSTPPPPDQQAAWKNHYGWPLQGAISSTQLEALLNLPASSSTYLSPNFSLDCSDAQMTRALLFTLKLDGRWHITVYM